MAATIKERVTEEMKTAMRAQDKERLAVIRLILSEIKRVEVDGRVDGLTTALDEARELAILDKMLKQRKESITQFKAAGREELAAKEQYEIEVIQSFMPAPLSDSEIHNLVASAIKESSAASMQDMGKVMAILKPQLQGKADMTVVSAKIKALLTAS